jgi:hypothetical protein
MTINERVYSFETKSEKGFVKEEIEHLLSYYPSINMNKFNNALVGITGIIDENGSFVFYKDDIEKALIIGMNKTKPNSINWD